MEIEAARLNVVFDQGAERPVVLLHGVENDGRFWIDTARRLSATRRAICLDLLGFGGSPRPDVAYSADEHADAVLATLDESVDASDPITLVGHSLGAIVAARCAAREPGRFRRLVLFGPPVCRDEVDPGGAPTDRLKAAFRKRFPDIRRAGVALTGIPHAEPVLGPERLATYRSSLLSIENTIEREDVAGDLLLAAPVPVTVVYGVSDPYVVAAYVESFAALRDGIEVVRLDAAHDVAHRRPRETLAAIDPDA